MAISKAMQGGAQGVKIKVSGRLGGKEIAGSEWLKDGRIPLHTLRSDIDYGFAQANTSFGAIGVKVWVYNGEILDKSKKDDAGLLVRKSARDRADGVEARS
jgi:small subunit ribosomal protein S3